MRFGAIEITLGGSSHSGAYGDRDRLCLRRMDIAPRLITVPAFASATARTRSAQTSTSVTMITSWSTESGTHRTAVMLSAPPFLLNNEASPTLARDTISPRIADENSERETKENGTGNQNYADRDPLNAHARLP
jgi:hypothetical protein